jgi:hypothetical protein
MLDFLSTELKSRALIRGRTPVFLASDALAVIHQAKVQRKTFLGIDGFVIKAGSTQPFQEHSVDFTDGVYAGGDEYEFAIKFIQERVHLGL